MIGQSLGRYHILEQLGEGGMATVYKAFDTRLEREVAIKFIRKERLSGDRAETVLKRFKREAQALAKLSHPNILTVLDYGEHEGQLYLVTEYLPGGSLKQRLAKPMHWTEAAKLLAPIGRALEYAHSQHILHRDVKPANILLSPSGLPVLADFGIAKLLEGEETTELTRADVGIGTPEYMAPEQGRGKADARSDIYSLGVVFYELVTGRKPYNADTPLAVLLMHATDPLPRPKSFVRDLPDDVERVIFKALAKKPEDRFQDVATFAAALENLAQRRKLSVGKVSRVSGADFRRLTALAGLILIAVGALIVGGFLVANGRGSQFAVGQQTVISVITMISATPAVTLVTATPPPTPTSTPPKPTPTIDVDPLMYDNFTNPENDGEFNATRWVRNRDSDNGVKILQQDGYLSLSTSGLEEQEWGGLVARDYEGFTIDKPAFFEADLMLNKGGKGGNVAFGFWADADGGWEIDCGVRGSSPISSPTAACSEYVQGTSQFYYYSTNSVSVEYDTWHRLRVEIDPTTMTFNYFSDDMLIGTHTPLNAERLKRSAFSFSVRTWQPGKVAVAGRVDNVRIGILPAWATTASQVSTAIITATQTQEHPAFQRTLDVPAGAGWVSSGVLLQAGQLVRVIASGTVNLSGTPSSTSNPNGGSACDRSDCLLLGAPWGALIGRVGNGVPFVLGASSQFTAAESGELYLAVSDCGGDCLSDNSGAFSVTVSFP